MRRLQVGWLALIVNDTEQENIGKTVKLIQYRGESVRGKFSMSIINDCWEVHCDDGLMFPDGSINKINGFTSSRNLMPLGDQQTQDELAKEKELEHG